MVRITKISAGTILLILSIILMIKSGFENFIAALVGTGAIGGAAGILLAITYIIAAAVYILTNRSYSVVPDVVSFVILILGGLMGLFNSSLPGTKFLVIWSWIGIVIGAIVLIISIADLILHPATEEDEEPLDDNYDQPNNYQQNQNNQYPQQNYYQQPMQYQDPNQNQFGQSPYQQPNPQFNQGQNGYQGQNPQFNQNQGSYQNNQYNNQNRQPNQYPQNNFNPQFNQQNQPNRQFGSSQQSQQTNYPVPTNNGQFNRNNQINNNQMNHNNQPNRPNQFGNMNQNNQMGQQTMNRQFGQQQQGFNPQQNPNQPNQAPTNGPYGFKNFDPTKSRSHK
ncbi:hypothetical protein M5C72_12415 [Companilactobacillus allii]|uniref:Uncharacterized protein n=1 Tax=Companilactobacillus allii TaxID=1847728 RepID=A0A1P8Q140_9LACO|nr:hypothetical protein [Companilactobacillus allii]APX71545.1 hypothetical protein BTM29_02770 [Companilactobacillus allii]USQ68627.1 hypothetical protein M5C72_12415 [Companilactobacillus allii]